MSNQPDSDQQYEDRRKHLEFVQAVIARMASASATAKGWSLTLGGAAVGAAIIQRTWYLLLIGLFILFWFSVLDAYYLHQERRFRDLHESIRNGSQEVFDMRPPSPPSEPGWKAWFSMAVAGFYSVLCLAGVALLGVVLLRG